MFQSSSLNTNRKQNQAWKDNTNNDHKGENGFSIVRGEEWTFICPIDFVYYQFNSRRDNSGFIVPHRVFIKLRKSRIFIWQNLLIQYTGTCQRKW